MTAVDSWVWGEEEKGGGVGGQDPPIRGLGKVGKVWEGFDDEVEDEQEQEDEEINDENEDDDGVGVDRGDGGEVGIVKR